MSRTGSESRAQGVARKLASRTAQRTEFEAWLASNPDKLPGADEQERLARLSARAVVAEMRSGAVSAESVMVTMCARALRCGQAIMSNTEEMFAEAVAKAAALDAARARGQSVDDKMLLYGLPVSIKDHIDVAGTDSTAGIMARVNRPMEKDAALVSALVDAGAIPFVKSNVPLMLMLPVRSFPLFACLASVWLSIT